MSFDAWLDWWFSSKWLTWGLGPYLAINLGAWPLGLFLEWYIKRPGVSLVTWKGGTGSRMKDLAKTQAKLPLSRQLWDRQYGSVLTLAGPPGILGAVVSAYLLAALVGMKWEPLNVSKFLFQVGIMEVLCDLGLYLGHRILHEVPFLYKHHAVHHALETPTPLGAVYIDFVDALIQGSIPIIVSMAIVRPHPVSAYYYIGFRGASSIANHTGLENCWWLNIIFLKYSWLGRAQPSHHDSHHKYGSRSGTVMNLGEGFWVWDWAFGTLRDRNSMRLEDSGGSNKNM